MDIMSDRQSRLLVVDDNEMNRDMLSRRLSRRGHTVETAEGGQHPRCGEMRTEDGCQVVERMAGP